MNVDVVQDCQKEVEIKEGKHHYFQCLLVICTKNAQCNDLKKRLDNDYLMGEDSYLKYY